jgi:uncharacterized membrane protein YphA (DoxX/SURF4 family)
MAGQPEPQRASLIWIGLLRMINGGLFLWAGVKKLQIGFRGPELLNELKVWSHAGKTFDFAQDLLKQYVIPESGNFALAVTAGELVAGASLFVGFASRLGALIALVLNVSYFLASQETINLLMAVVDLAVLSSGGGRAIGIDGVMKARNPRWIFG